MKIRLALVLALFSSVASAATAPPKVVFIGDQFTYNWGATPGAFPSNWINQGWMKTTSLPSCVDLCYGGTSESTADRFQADVIDLHPAIVHIMVGADDADVNNDASQPTTWGNYLAALQTMVKMAKAANIQVILGIESPTWPSEGDVRPMNSIVANYGAQSGVTVVNYADALCRCVSSAGTLDGASYLTGTSSQYGLTPLPAGYALMTQMAETAIATINLKLTGGYLQNFEPANVNIGVGQNGVNVNNVPTGAYVQFTAYGLYPGIAAQPLLNTGYTAPIGTWASSNPLVMSVNQAGLTYALTAGTATITYTPASAPSGVRIHGWGMTVVQ